MAFPDGWSRLATITVPSANVSAALTDFPVLITRAGLPDSVCDPSGTRAVQADGGDLRITTDEAGASLVPLHVVSFGHDTTTGQGNAAVRFWFKAPSLSASADTVFHLWGATDTAQSQPVATDPYGRNAVWADYIGSWHMEDPSVSVDATGGGNDLTFTTGVTATTSPIGAAIALTSGESGSTPLLDTDQDYTISVIARNSGDMTTFGQVAATRGGGADSAGVKMQASGPASFSAAVVSNSETFSSSINGTSWPSGQWHVLTVATTLGNGSQRVYQNGTEYGSTTATRGTGNRKLTLTLAGATEMGFAQALIRKGLSASEWIAAEAANQTSPETFVTSAEVDLPAGASISSAVTSSDSYSAIAALAASVSATANASAGYVAVSQIAASLTEAVSAQDSDAGPAQALAAISSSTTDSDLLDAIAQAAAAITAGAAAGESWVSESQAPGVDQAAIAEGTEAGAAFVAAVSTIAQLTGAASISDAAAATIEAISSVSEGAAAADTNSVVGQILAAINESVLALAIYAAAISGSVMASVSDGATVSDSWVGTGPSGYLVAGAITITAALSVSLSISPAFDASVEINPS